MMKTSLSQALACRGGSLMVANYAIVLVHSIIRQSLSAGESRAKALVRVAKASGCHTIAIGKQHGFGFLEQMHMHNADKLVRAADGLTLWIVE
jgi:hypothetical protein